MAHKWTSSKERTPGFIVMQQILYYCILWEYHSVQNGTLNIIYCGEFSERIISVRCEMNKRICFAAYIIHATQIFQSVINFRVFKTIYDISRGSCHVITVPWEWTEQSTYLERFRYLYRSGNYPLRCFLICLFRFAICRDGLSLQINYNIYIYRCYNLCKSSKGRCVLAYN